MGSVLNDRKLEELIDRLHRQSADQFPAMAEYFGRSSPEGRPVKLDEDEIRKFLSDKLVALERDKADFCYMLCRAVNATRIVEVGTSYGVSTLYLAAALRDNLRLTDLKGVVIGTEYEPNKASAARANFAKAGLSDFIDLREGDLRETLKDLRGSVDFVLLDIWPQMARPALELIAPRLRAGSVIICDNTKDYRDTPSYIPNYRDYFEFISDPANRFNTMTLPFQGGLELTIRL